MHLTTLSPIYYITIHLLAEFKNQLLDQHRQLYRLNSDLISSILAYATAAQAWDEPFGQGQTIQETIGYLRMIHTGALTAENLKLIEAATDLTLLQELSEALQQEIDHHLAWRVIVEVKIGKQDGAPSATV